MRSLQILPTSSERSILDSIKKGPYYSLRFVPGVDDLTLPKARIRELVANEAVRLRGWDFPANFHDRVYNAANFVGHFLEFNSHVEVWRFYTSGQFLYFGSPWDIFEDMQARIRDEFNRSVILPHPSARDTVSGVLSFVGLIYSLTEFHLWSSRLMSTLELTDANLRVAMRNIAHWALASGEPLSLFHSFCQATADHAELSVPPGPLLATDPVQTANLAARELFEYFNWNPDEATVRAWQDRLISRRFAH